MKGAYTVEDLIVVLILVAITVGIGIYLFMAKRRGQACIGCPYSKSCGSKCGGNCSCSAHTDSDTDHDGGMEKTDR